MQTFLPYADFSRTARVLDRQRLGNQRGEAKIILKVLMGKYDKKRTPWLHHPAVGMWSHHAGALCMYLKAIIDEWVRRGYRNEKQDVKTLHVPGDDVRGGLHEEAMLILDPGTDASQAIIMGPTIMPPWIGNEAFHASHRSNLLRKNPSWYGKFGWAEPPDLPYVWPGVK